MLEKDLWNELIELTKKYPPRKTKYELEMETKAQLFANELLKSEHSKEIIEMLKSLENERRRK